MPGRRFQLLCIAGLFGMLGTRVPAATPEAYNPWPGLVQDIFNNRPMNDSADVIGIEMPYRAEDAAIVPVTLRTKLPLGDSHRVLRITLRTSACPSSTGYRLEWSSCAIPSPLVAFACGSRSTSNTRSPRDASAAERLIAVVVLPTPRTPVSI